MKLSICIIMKDEEKVLEECLKRLQPLTQDPFCELILVDTGSSDQTKEIAARYTEKVYDFTWIKDFAAARNASIEWASGDYILVVDCDEWLEEIDVDGLLQMIKAHPHAVGRITRINEYTRDGELYRMKETVSRLFPKGEYHYRGRIHEQIVREDGGRVPVYEIPLSFLHCGYEGDLEERKKKTQRNIQMLLAELEEQEDPYILFQLGKSYYMQKDYAEAEAFFDRALWYDLDPELLYVQDLVESYGYALLAQEKYEKALGLLGVYDTFAGSADFLFLVALIRSNNGYFQEALEEYQRVLKMPTCRVEGVNSYLAYYNMGVIEECLGHREEACMYYAKAKNYERARERLKILEKF